MSSGKTILIIEDNLDSLQIYGEILRDENFKVIETQDGQAALDYLKQHANVLPSLILMDLTFPHMSAKDFVSSLTSREQWRAIPIVVISGQVNTSEQALELKAKGFLKKPFDIDPFISMIKKIA